MTLHVLDTDVLSHYQRGHPAVSGHVLGHSVSELATTVITVEEQLSSWYTMLRRAKDRARRATIYTRLADQVRFLSSWQILDFPETAMDRFDKLIAMKLNIKANDLRIAAIVLENSAVLVTRNLRDFQKIPHIVLEDWMT